MVIGGCVYTIFREKSLLMFKWFNLLGISKQIDYLRVYFSEINIPNWILFNYPDGVWIYSFVSLMLIVWENEESSLKKFWYMIVPILGICAEIGQYINIVPGTFDILDLFFCLIGTILPFILISRE